MPQMAAIIMHVATGNIDEEMFGRIIPHVIKGDMDLPFNRRYIPIDYPQPEVYM